MHAHQNFMPNYAKKITSSTRRNAKSWHGTWQRGKNKESFRKNNLSMEQKETTKTLSHHYSLCFFGIITLGHGYFVFHNPPTLVIPLCCGYFCQGSFAAFSFSKRSFLRREWTEIKFKGIGRLWRCACKPFSLIHIHINSMMSEERCSKIRYHI